MTQDLATRNFPIPAAVGSLDGYIHAVNQVPMLAPEQEQALARQYVEREDLEAARELVLAHLRFVVHVARGYLGYGLPMADLVQEGNIGLMKAVKRFDPDVGVRLVSFAVHWIKAEIHEYILKNWRIVKVATTKAQRKLFFNLRRAKKRLGWLSADEVNIVARELNVSPTDVVEMESRLNGRDIGFDAPSDNDDDDVPPAPAAYLIHEGLDPEQAAVNDDQENRQQDTLYASLSELDERSRDIVARRWLNEPKVTLQELADEYGVSAERIRQIEAAAMKKMRASFEA